MRRTSAVVGGLAYLLATVAWVLVLALVGYVVVVSLPVATEPAAPPVSIFVPDPHQSNGEAGSNVLARVVSIALALLLTFGVIVLVVLLPLLFARWCSRAVHSLTRNLYGRTYSFKHLMVVKGAIMTVPAIILVIVWAVAPSVLTASLAISGVIVALAAVFLGAVQGVLAQKGQLKVKEIF